MAIETFLTIIALTFLGGFIGAVFGMLLAPRAGAETRAHLSESMEDLQDKMGKIIEEARMNSEDLIKTTRSSLEEKIAVTQHFAARVLPWLKRGLVRPVLDRVFPFEDVRAAQGRLESNLVFGKVVLRL